MITVRGQHKPTKLLYNFILLQQSASATDDVTKLKEQWNRVADLTESRTKLSLAYIAFHKKAQQLAVQMDALEQYVRCAAAREIDRTSTNAIEFVLLL